MIRLRPLQLCHSDPATSRKECVPDDGTRLGGCCEWLPWTDGLFDEATRIQFRTATEAFTNSWTNHLTIHIHSNDLLRHQKPAESIHPPSTFSQDMIVRVAMMDDLLFRNDQ